MIYVKGDIHGDVTQITNFCIRNNPTYKDIIIIAGDAGINYSGRERDAIKKEALSLLEPTIFCVHGNHEMRPQTIPSYKTKLWNDGVVFYEEEFPNILFAKDGEIYDLEGIKTIVIGGAYSVDKDIRLLRRWAWFEDEQPSEEIKTYVEEQLEKNNWEIDVVISHTVPLKYEPVEVFISGVNQRKVDKSTEEWLDSIEDRLSYKKWYAGHFHTDKIVDKLRLLFNDFDELSLDKIREISNKEDR